MKKLIFTVLTVISFSGVSFANSDGVKEENKATAGNVKKLEFFGDCYSKAADYIDNQYDPQGTHTDAQNNDAYQAYLAGCQGNKLTVAP